MRSAFIAAGLLIGLAAPAAAQKAAYDPWPDLVVNVFDGRPIADGAGIIAREAPSRADPQTIKDTLVALFHAVSEADPAHYVRGQYDGYLDVDGVAPDSTTETFAALRLEIENWRWSGVPFFIRAGKCLATTQTELRLVFKKPPKLRFAGSGVEADPNQLVIKLDPSPGIRLVVQAHRADRPGGSRIDLDMEFAAKGGEGPTPYEVLLHAAIEGRGARFGRQDTVEEAWRVMQPLIDNPPPVRPYAPGTWGPYDADMLVAEHGGWREPWL